MLYVVVHSFCYFNLLLIEQNFSLFRNYEEDVEAYKCFYTHLMSLFTSS